MSSLLAAQALQPSYAPRLVSTSKEASDALASARPGDEIVFADGEYDLGALTITIQTTEDRPLTIRAEHLGKAKFIGSTAFIFRQCAFVTLDGFRFESKDGTVIQIAGSHHVRITRNHFQLAQPEGADRTHAITDVRGLGDDHRPHWLEISGLAAENINSHHNRIDHNRFQDKHTIGNFISVVGIGAPAFQISQYDRIDHNHFLWISPRISNGMEAIRAGLSYLSMSQGFTEIESNLFENCDGDPEIISVKQCNGIVRHNTFVSCEGGVCLRHGNGSEVSGNFFFGNGKRGSTGIRPYGDDDRIFNNYFEGLTGPALQLVNGDFDYGNGELQDRELLKKHFRPQRLFVAFNTIVNCDVPVETGTGNAGYPIKDLTMANNLIVGGGKEQSIKIGPTPPDPITWMGNIVSTGESGKVGVELPEDQLRVLKLKLTDRQGGILRPEPSGANVDSAVGKFEKIMVDIDGQQRTGKYDVGADEQSDGKVIYHPLTPADVGPEGRE
ncbi:MAG TPA: polysaccharide lyase 6 family protein [Tepidisphaeraceae bacterium]